MGEEKKEEMRRKGEIWAWGYEVLNEPYENFYGVALQISILSRPRSRWKGKANTDSAVLETLECGLPSNLDWKSNVFRKRM